MAYKTAEERSAYNKEWYRKNKEKAQKRHAKWFEENPDKQKEYTKKYYNKNKEELSEKNKNWFSKNKDKRREWYRKNREEILRKKKEWLEKNKEKSAQYAATYREKHPDMSNRQKTWKMERLNIPEHRIIDMFRAAKQRCRANGPEFDPALIDQFLKNIPTRCACCAHELDYVYKSRSHKERHRSYGPSLDRIDSSKGYIEGNVAVTCSRCNFTKNDSTLEELRHIVAYLEREQAKRATENKKESE